MTDCETFIQKIKCQNYKICDELLAEHDNHMRTDVIDEYAEKLCDKVCNDAYITMVKCSDGTFIECDIWTVDSLIDLIFDLAEQLKEQNNE